jgi:hypothetical protein
VGELVRGTVFDRPWGRTLGSLGLRGLTGQLTLTADGKTYEIAFANGAVVGASSPSASDAAVRVALTGGLISTTQVSELARKQAAAPGRDEIDIITEHLKLGFDQSMRLRRRTIAQRAARSFSVDRGDFVVTDTITLPTVAGSELDVRAVIFLGAKQNLSEARLASELGLFGTWFRLKPEAFEDLPQFGFTDAERPIIDQLLNGASLGDLEAIVGIDGRSVRATLYALCAANACNVEQTRGQGTTKPPMLRPGAGSEPGIKRPSVTSQPPTTPTAPPTTPRERRPSAQPLVAYRPGRRKEGSQPPPSGVPLPPRAQPSSSLPPMQRTSQPTPPTPSRTATPTPSPHQAVPAPTVHPALERSGPATNPGIPRHPQTEPPQTGPTRIPRRAQSEPGIPISATGSSPAAARTGSGTNPNLRPGVIGSSPGIARTLTTPPLSRTTTPPPRTTPPPSRTTPPPSRLAAGARSGTHTSIPVPNRKNPTLTAGEVMVLIEGRAKQLDQGVDHYALLGVAPQAPADEVRKTYFNLARSLHPDRLAALGIADESHVAHKVFAQLNTAFATLSDAKRRAEYDELLGRGGEAAMREEQERAEELALRVLASEEAFKRAELAVKRDDLDTALAELAKAIELNPDEPDFYALHAWATFCAAADKNTVARQTRATLERAVQKSPKAINPRLYLGRVERMLGRDKEALDLFRDIIADKPSHHEAQSEIRAIEARLKGKKK